jgi:hypothetical protein
VGSVATGSCPRIGKQPGPPSLPRGLRAHATRQRVAMDRPHLAAELLPNAARLYRRHPRRPCPQRAPSSGSQRSPTVNLGQPRHPLICITARRRAAGQCFPSSRCRSRWKTWIPHPLAGGQAPQRSPPRERSACSVTNRAGCARASLPVVDPGICSRLRPRCICALRGVLPLHLKLAVCDLRADRVNRQACPHPGILILWV